MDGLVPDTSELSIEVTPEAKNEPTPNDTEDDVVIEIRHDLSVQPEAKMVPSPVKALSWGIPENKSTTAESWGSLKVNRDSWSVSQTSWIAPEVAPDSVSDVSGWGLGAASMETWGSTNAVTIDNWSSVSVDQESSYQNDAEGDDQVTC